MILRRIENKKVINTEINEDYFKNHVATFYNFDKIKILDFTIPGSFDNQIRFIFENDNSRLHITGDYGDLVTKISYKLSLYFFPDFFVPDNEPFFEDTISIMNYPLYVYDKDSAKKSLRKVLDEHDAWDTYRKKHRYLGINDENDILDDILQDFSVEKGIGDIGNYRLLSIIDESWRFIYKLGKLETNIIKFYMFAFRLAMEQVKYNEESKKMLSRKK